jgi:hypothetical protein
MQPNGGERMNRIMMSVAALGLATVLSVPANAQNRTFENTRVIQTIAESDLLAALREIDATAARQPDSDKRYDVTFDDDSKAVVVRAGCKERDCYGVLMLAFFTPPSGVSSSALDERVRKFNIDYNPASAFRADTGDYVLKNYVITDDGITMGNLAITLSLFQEMVGIFSDEFYYGQ